MAHEGTDLPRTTGLNNTWPGRTSTTWAGLSAQLADSVLDSSLSDPNGQPDQPSARWMGWRLRMLVVLALLGCLGMFGLIRALTMAPQIDASWRVDAQGHIQLAASADPALRPHVGQALKGVLDGAETIAMSDPLALLRSPRWVIDDAERVRQQALHGQLAAALAQPEVQLVFADGSTVALRPVPRGLMGLPVMFWVLSLFGWR